MKAYHSALSSVAVQDAPPSYYFKSQRGSIALVHDAVTRDGAPNPLPAEFAQCDILWVEPPWPKGQDVFDRRAGASHEWRQVWAAVARVAAQNTPMVVVGSVRHRIELPEPENCVRTKLHGYPAVLYLFNGVEGLMVREVDDITYVDREAALRQLAQRYECVGDFMCGYGQTGQVFAGAGKRYVMADYNPRCIGYVASVAHGWEWGLE